METHLPCPAYLCKRPAPTYIQLPRLRPPQLRFYLRLPTSNLYRNSFFPVIFEGDRADPALESNKGAHHDIYDCPFNHYRKDTGATETSIAWNGLLVELSPSRPVTLRSIPILKDTCHLAAHARGVLRGRSSLSAFWPLSYARPFGFQCLLSVAIFLVGPNRHAWTQWLRLCKLTFKVVKGGT